jgi:hypothetical protein
MVHHVLRDFLLPVAAAEMNHKLLKREYRYSRFRVWLLSLSVLMPAPHCPLCSLGSILVPKLEKVPCLAH